MSEKKTIRDAVLTLRFIRATTENLWCLRRARWIFWKKFGTEPNRWELTAASLGEYIKV